MVLHMVWNLVLLEKYWADWFYVVKVFKLWFLIWTFLSPPRFCRCDGRPLQLCEPLK